MNCYLWYNGINEFRMKLRKGDFMLLEQLHENRITALYCRLSRDDGYADDSCSIDSQKAMLERYASDNGLKNYEFFVDDGFTGTNFDRPSFSRMIGSGAGSLSCKRSGENAYLLGSAYEVGSYILKES